MKQETLEEAAEKYNSQFVSQNEFAIEDFINGAKWQAENMFSEQETKLIEGLINLADLKNKITKLANTDVLNGIAYNPKTKTIFVTGKNWDKMFEITVGE